MVVLPRSRSRHGVHAAAAIMTLVASVVVLSACTSTPKPTAQTPKPSHSSIATSAPTPTTTPQPAVVYTPVTISCDQLLTAAQVSAFNPNYAPNPDYTPKPNTDAAQIAGYKGITCSWRDQTNGQTIDIAVAKPPSGTMTTLKNSAVMVGTAVPTYGNPPIEGYFGMVGTLGEFQVFSGDYWIAGTSTTFTEPGAAETLVANILGNLAKS